jgi:hypothetical protein
MEVLNDILLHLLRSESGTLCEWRLVPCSTAGIYGITDLVSEVAGGVD